MIPQLQRETPVSAPEVAQWSLPTKIAFRYTFVYFLLWFYPRAVGSLGRGRVYNNPLKDLWYVVVPWVGTHILGLKGDFREIANGSGDQLYDYVLLFCIAVVAAVATLIWSYLDRKRANYSVLYQWVRILMRIKLTIVMIDYGTAKLWWAQFPAPHLERLIEPYGQTQPADLMWTFMGMSRAYSFFGGIGEMLGGMLLLFPRMVTLGSLVTAAVMTNVLMLNLGYDVPRKIYCIHLILICLYLITPDLRRMLDFFVFNRPAQLAKPVPLFKDRLLNLGVLALVFGLAAVSFKYDAHLYSTTAQGSMAKLPAPLRGIWNVDELFVDGVYRPPLVTDAERWRRVVLDTPYVAVIQPMDGPQHRYMLKPDLEHNALLLSKPATPDVKYTVTYSNPDPNHLTLQGEINGQQVKATLSRMDTSDPLNFALTTRGVHWVNMYMHWINQEENWH